MENEVRLLDANALVLENSILMEDEYGLPFKCVLEEDIRSAPTVDAVPVVHGRCSECRGRESTLFDAMESIIWYDGHYEWLRTLKDILLGMPEGDILTCPFDSEEWGQEQHVIWMLLVGMFGNWGTSIRGGWIDKPKECAEFIEAVCKESWEEGE